MKSQVVGSTGSCSKRVVPNGGGDKSEEKKYRQIGKYVQFVLRGGRPQERTHNVCDSDEEQQHSLNNVLRRMLKQM